MMKACRQTSVGLMLKDVCAGRKNGNAVNVECRKNVPVCVKLPQLQRFVEPETLNPKP